MTASAGVLLILALEAQEFNCFASGGQNLYAGTMSGGIYYSSDEGSNWTQTEIINTRVECLVQNSAYIFANERECGIFRSGDGGNNWTKVGSLLHNKKIFTWGTLYSLYTFKTNLIIGIGINEFYRQTAYRSTDNGTNWEEMKVFEGSGIHAIIEKGDSIWAGVGWGGEKAGIYLSIDHGFTWGKIS